MVKAGKNQFAMDFSPLQFAYKSERLIGQIPDWFRRGDEPIFRHIFWRLHKNMNTIILIVGAVRTGKSYIGLKLGEGYMKRIGKIPFDVRKQMSFEIIPFLKWSMTAKDSVFILDEVGVSLSTQEWYTIQNRVFAQFCQTQGFRRNLMILILPHIGYLNKQVRFLCNYVIETIQQGSSKLRKMKMDYTFGKGFPTNIGIIKCGLPTKKTVDFYEQTKKVWNDKMLVDSIAIIEADKFKRDNKFKREYDPYLPKSYQD